MRRLFVLFYLGLRLRVWWWILQCIWGHGYPFIWCSQLLLLRLHFRMWHVVKEHSLLETSSCWWDHIWSCSRARLVPASTSTNNECYLRVLGLSASLCRTRVLELTYSSNRPEDRQRNPPTIIRNGIHKRCSGPPHRMLRRVHHLDLLGSQRDQREGKQEDNRLWTYHQGLRATGFRRLCGGHQRGCEWAQGTAKGIFYHVLLPNF